MELSELRAFVKVVQSGSFTKAAEQLNTQRGNVSRSVANLESKLQVRLLERTTRSLSLTEIGKEIYQRGQAILSAVEDTQLAAQNFSGFPKGELKITCSVEFGTTVVNQWVCRYLGLFENVTVTTEYTNRKVDIVHEGYDLAIRVGELPDSRLAARKLGDVHYALYASPHYLEKYGSPLDPFELTHHKTIALTSGHLGSSWDMVLDNRKFNVPYSPIMRSNSSLALVNSVVEGLGIGRLPELLVRDKVKQGQLVKLFPDWQMETIPVNALFPNNRYLSPKVRQFIDLAVFAFAEHNYHSKSC